MKKSVLCIISLVLLSSCSLISPNNGSNFDPWDKLGGGGIASVGSEENISINDYDNISSSFSDIQLDESISESNIVNFNDLSSLPNGVSLSSSTLTISLGGTYLLKGEFIGQLVVDKCNDKDVRIIFDNVKITSKGSTAPITFKKTTAHRVLTLKEGTTSYIEDNILNSGVNSDESVIEVKSCPFTINGKGKLMINAKGDNSNGIEANDTLNILNSNLEINANNHGIKVNNKIVIENSNIKIDAKMDGIKTDINPISLEEAKTLANSLENGFISIKNTSLDINSSDDGISSNSFIFIENDLQDIINIITNGGAPTSNKNYGSDSLNGKGIKVEGISYFNGTTETKIASTHEDNYSLIINGGTYSINSNNDSISSSGNTLIEDGKFNINAGDDGIHSEYTSVIRNGEINILSSYEGIEGSGVEIFNGIINVNSYDDGINASNSEVQDYDFHIYINGGNISVDSMGDGVDSNGWIKMDGGTLLINGPTSGMNGSLDTDKGFLLTKGNLIAVGSRGMVETPSSNSTQCYINVNLSSIVEDSIIVKDKLGKEIINVTPNKKYQSIVLSSEEFIKGETYSIVIGSNQYEATLTSIGTALGTNSSGNQNQGHMPGGPGGRPR